jgi:hypothetical protein
MMLWLRGLVPDAICQVFLGRRFPTTAEFHRLESPFSVQNFNSTFISRPQLRRC